MQIHIHPAIINKPYHEMQRILGHIQQETGLVDIITDQGAMLVYPEISRKTELSEENALRLKNYRRRKALHKQDSKTNSINIY